MRRWTKQWDATRDADRPGAGRARRRAWPQTVPATQRSGIMHGDYRLDNCLLDPTTPGRIAAVLDWEMSTLGDPLTDLGMLFVYWPQARRGPGRLGALGVDRCPGFPTRAGARRAVRRTAAARTSRTLRWYVASPTSSSPRSSPASSPGPAAGAMAGKDTAGYADRIDPSVELGRAALDDGAL